jgi:hypothetical protein
VVVEDGPSFEKIPAITGSLAYRKDNQLLHVRKNDTWKVLAEEEKLDEKVRVL